MHKYPIVDAFFQNQDMKYLYSLDKGGNLFVWKWVEDRSEAYMKRLETIKRKLNRRRGYNPTSVKKEEYQSDNEEEEDEKVDHTELETERKQMESMSVQEYSEFELKALSGRFVLIKKLIVSQPHSQVSHC